MSHWDTPDTRAKALRDVMSRPLKARFAGRNLEGLAGSDVLFDRIDELSLSSPYSDVRAIVSNWLEAIVFSLTSPLDVVDEDAVAVLAEVTSREHERDAAVPGLARFGDEDFRQLLSDVEPRHRPELEWRIAPDDGGFDLFSLSDDGEMYRFSKIDGGLVDIHPDNMPRYATRFETALEAAP